MPTVSPYLIRKSGAVHVRPQAHRRRHDRHCAADDGVRHVGLPGRLGALEGGQGIPFPHPETVLRIIRSGGALRAIQGGAVLPGERPVHVPARLWRHELEEVRQSLQCLTACG